MQIRVVKLRVSSGHNFAVGREIAISFLYGGVVVVTEQRTIHVAIGWAPWVRAKLCMHRMIGWPKVVYAA